MNTKIISFAIEAHQKVNHLYDNKPYSVHLSMVALYVLKYMKCVPSEKFMSLMDAAWLHDTIEDCRLTYNDIKEVSSLEVTEIVYALTNSKGKNREERADKAYYEGILKVPFARYVKLCDRLANVAYSRDTNSKMLSVYKKEHLQFIEALFPAGSDLRHYQCMVDELDYLLNGE